MYRVSGLDGGVSSENMIADSGGPLSMPMAVFFWEGGLGGRLTDRPEAIEQLPHFA